MYNKPNRFGLFHEGTVYEVTSMEVIYFGAVIAKEIAYVEADSMPKMQLCATATISTSRFGLPVMAEQRFYEVCHVN